MNSTVSFRLRIRSIVLLCALLAIVCDCNGTLDLSNLDLKNFQFFRYTQVLPNGEIRNVMAPPPSIHDHFNRAKAVATYFRKLLLGNTAYDAQTVSIVFNPNVDHLRQKFQQKYGYRGSYLIESLGKGYVPSIVYRQSTIME